jgi:hypothetical protein
MYVFEKENKHLFVTIFITKKCTNSLNEIEVMNKSIATGL